MSTLQKILRTGLGAALITESSIRSAFSDIKVTGQAKDYMGRQIQKAKDEIIRVLMEELKNFLSHLDLQEELKKALSNLKVDVQATITLTPRPGGKSTKLSVSKNFKVNKK